MPQMFLEELAERISNIENWLGKLASCNGYGFDYYQSLKQIDFKYGHIDNMSLAENWDHIVTTLELKDNIE